MARIATGIATLANAPPKTRQVIGVGAAAVALVVFLVAAEPSLIVNGLFLGSAIALGAIGISLIYGILRFAHIAHGDFMTLGAYVTFFLLTEVFPRIGFEGTGLGLFTFGWPLIATLPITVVIVIALAVILDVLVYRHLRGRRSSLVIMAMASLGVAIAARGFVQMIWGTQPERYPRVSKLFYQLPFDIRVPPDNLFLGGAAVCFILGLYLFLRYTKMGKAMRATSDNADLARVSGINTERIIWWTWGIAAAFAASAGTLIAVSQAQLLPTLGWKILIPLFAAVILGGVGNPWGALAGALVIGVSMEVSTQWISPAYKPAIAFAIMLAVLLVRPRGIFGGTI